MKRELEEYRLAVEDNLLASKAEVDARIWKKKAHYRLIKASEELRAKTRELLEDLVK